VLDARSHLERLREHETACADAAQLVITSFGDELNRLNRMSAFELQAFQRSVYQARITLASCELDEATDFAEALADERTTLTEAALGAFIINLRRRAYGEQAYLRNTIEPRTDGCSDILAEQTMFDLAETVVADNRELYVESLAEIHRALHCVSMNEALALSEAMAAALDDAVAMFPEAKRESARRALATSLSNVVLIMVDATKWAGPNSLYWWLQDERHLIRRGLANGSGAIPLAGLWLEDPDTTALARVGQLCEHETVRASVAESFTDGGAASKWTVRDVGLAAKSQWRVQGGKLTQATRIDDKKQSATYALLGKANGREFDVVAEVGVGQEAAAGIVARYLDSKNHYRVEIDGVARAIRLLRVDGGKMSELDQATFADLEIGVQAALELQARGGRLRVTLAGRPMIDVSDDRPRHGGKAGVYTWKAGGVSVESFSILEPTDSSACCVSVSGLIEALSDPLRIGLGTCPAASMVRGCFDPTVGYRCREQLCLPEGETGIEGLDRMRARGESPYGVALGQLDNLACGEDANGNAGSGGGASAIQTVVGRLGGAFACLHPDAFAERRAREGYLVCTAAVARADDGVGGATAEQLLAVTELNQCGSRNAADTLGGALAAKAVEAGMACAKGAAGRGVLGCLGGVAKTAVDTVIDTDADNKRLDKKLQDDLQKLYEEGQAELKEIAARKKREREARREERRRQAEQEAQREQAQNKANFEHCVRTSSTTGWTRDQCVEGSGYDPDVGQCAPGIGNCDSCSAAAAVSNALRECAGADLPPDEDGDAGNGVVMPDDEGSEDDLTDCLGLDAASLGQRTALGCGAITCEFPQAPTIVEGICLCADPREGDAIAAGSDCSLVINCGPGIEPVRADGQCACLEPPGDQDEIPDDTPSPRPPPES